MEVVRRVISPFLLFALGAGVVSSQTFKLSGSIDIGGEGGWDYSYADSTNRRLYVTHGNEVDVFDLDSRKPAGKISGLNRIHGVAIADSLNRGFISEGGGDDLAIFNLKTLAVESRVHTGTHPDGIVYDAASKRAFTFNGGSRDATAVDAANGTVAGTIPLGGRPEFPVSDGRGNIFANIEDKSEIVAIDAKTLKVKAHWPLSPCESPSGLAIDEARHRLFSVCGNKMMAVVNADSGKVVATPSIGNGPDAAAYDSGLKLAFSSNGEGTLTVVRAGDGDSYSVVENVPTAKGARTMALDEKTHTIYLPTAEFGPAPQPTETQPHPRPAILPGTFKVLIVSEASQSH